MHHTKLSILSFDHMPNYSIPLIKIEVDLKLFYNMFHTQEYLGTSRAKDEGSTRLGTITTNNPRYTRGNVVLEKY